MTGENGGVSHIVERTGRHDVAVTLQDQRLSGVGVGSISADHRARSGKIMLDRTEAAQVLQLLRIDMPVVHLVATLAQEVADHVLARPFGTAR